jgi:hypothetical protein
MAFLVTALTTPTHWTICAALAELHHHPAQLHVPHRHVVGHDLYGDHRQPVSEIARCAWLRSRLDLG